MKQYTYTTIECSLVIINVITLHNNINGAAVTSNKDEECLKSCWQRPIIICASRAVFGGGRTMCSLTAPAAPLSTHGWIASNNS